MIHYSDSKDSIVSRLDLNDSYLQTHLHTDCRDWITTNTPFGLYSYIYHFDCPFHRQFFQSVINSIIQSLVSTKSYQDNEEICGPNDSIHGDRHFLLLRCLCEFTITGNQSECIFSPNIRKFPCSLIDKLVLCNIVHDLVDILLFQTMKLIFDLLSADIFRWLALHELKFLCSILDNLKTKHSHFSLHLESPGGCCSGLQNNNTVTHLFFFLFGAGLRLLNKVIHKQDVELKHFIDRFNKFVNNYSVLSTQLFLNMNYPNLTTIRQNYQTTQLRPRL